MEITIKNEDGIVFQVKKQFSLPSGKGEYIKEALIDITYSSTEDGTLEFEWTSPERVGLTDDEFLEIEGQLDSGLEETVVLFLKEHYEKTKTPFDIGEWKHVPYSVLYEANAE
jgi:hypothetical protein